jgi:dihydrofolate synthase/folylpolyglutamate synthase
LTGIVREGRPRDLAGWPPISRRSIRRRSRWGSTACARCLARLDAAIACPVVTRHRHERQGIDLGDDRGGDARRRMADRALHVAAPDALQRARSHRGAEATDEALVAAFGAVEDARTSDGPPVPLTYFEFGTLAALLLFARSSPDVLVLEVGLGGRLDAVNAIDADVAIVTSVDVDHREFLGDTRDAIGREKAGVFRAGRVALCGDPDPPQSLLDEAARIGARLYVAGRDFTATAEGTQWRYRGPGSERFGLPHPALRGAYQLGNAACAIAAIDALRDRLPVSAGALRDGLVGVELPGRFQVLPGRPTRVLDVAHNPHAARALASCLASMGYHAQTHAVVGMLADKDIDGVVAALRGHVDRWTVAPLPGPRGASAQRLADALARAGVPPAAVRAAPDVESAWRAAVDSAGEADRIVAFGSFLTVAAALAADR